MIQFRCWYCNRGYSVAESRIGDRMVCNCGQRVRVPKANYKNSRSRSLLDFLIEWVVYGGGGAMLGFFLALFLLSRVFFLGRIAKLSLLVGCTLFGLLVGGIGGEAGINWIGRMLRNWEQR